MANDVEQAARRYIDRVIAINRRHGMTGHLPGEMYERAVEDAVRASAGLRRSQAPPTG